MKNRIKNDLKILLQDKFTKKVLLAKFGFILFLLALIVLHRSNAAEAPVAPPAAPPPLPALPPVTVRPNLNLGSNAPPPHVMVVIPMNAKMPSLTQEQFDALEFKCGEYNENPTNTVKLSIGQFYAKFPLEKARLRHKEILDSYVVDKQNHDAAQKSAAAFLESLKPDELNALKKALEDKK